MRTGILMAATAAVAILGTLAAVSGQLEQPASSESLTGLDYAEIQQLVARYAHAIDTCGDNGYDYARLYTPDGVYIDQYSDEAPIHAAMRADELLENGDLDGAAVWRRIVTAINELLADAPAGDASVH